VGHRAAFFMFLETSAYIYILKIIHMHLDIDLSEIDTQVLGNMYTATNPAII